MTSEALPPLREVIARHGLSARRSLGQHFLLDLNLTDRIARGAGDLSAGTTIEIGPGPGGLTRSLLRHGAARVIAVERDARAIAAIGELAALFPDRLQVIEADALTLDVVGLGTTPRRIVANLPYNISTPLLTRWLHAVAEHGPGALESMTLMFQREVADRLLARPRTKDYGRLSVLTQVICRVTRLFEIPPTAFVPAPKVVSSVVRLMPHAIGDRPQRLDVRALETVTAAAFGQRRKMLRSSLRAALPVPELALDACGIAHTARAEDIFPEKFVELSLLAHWKS